MPARLLLLVNSPDIKVHYERALNDINVEYDTVQTLTDLFDALSKHSYNGILMDVLTKTMQGSDEEKVSSFSDAGSTDYFCAGHTGVYVWL